ncbi:AraC family transcriptional regulator [Rhizobium glycinendophyticum]|uniref:AraC family transcriptional regulator n=1 Tax=Rhizobium glycinendophyticum TaxID=2589807 RepID=A0A504UG72_9HYPH|nr:AraC family transcriptional regulator [Rhizobium glycinendophyticum]TPP03973.1 AraC family transcriptional regulator [Rhizobium glycinendophyticum]
MKLPIHGPYSLTCDDVLGVDELYEAYGKLIGHGYVVHDHNSRDHVGEFENISALEACATRFQGGSRRFDMSVNHHGLDLVILSFGLSGQALLYQQNGVECVARNGSAILHTTDAPLQAQVDRLGEIMAVALPREKLSSIIGDKDALTPRVLPANSAAFSLFAGHARTFLSLGIAPDIGLAQLVGDQLCDLAALALGVNSRGREKVMSAETLNDVRYNKAINYITRHASDQMLSEKEIARQLGLSTSSVRQIFARKQTTPARIIRTVRVEMAARLLLDSKHRSSKIVSLAFDCGFQSVSAFYEAFRDHYGMQPSEFRASVRQTQD